MKTNKTFLIVAALIVAGCGPSTPEDLAAESERAYQSAMAELSSGQVNKAVGAFEEVIRKHPGNVDAYFQYACLMQDHAKDYLGALCAYRAFLVLAPKSDKAKLASERMSICERLYAPELAKKWNLFDNGALLAEIEQLKLEAKKAADERKAFESALAKAEADLAAQRRETARVRSLVHSVADDGEATEAATIVSARDLLDDEGDSASGSSSSGLAAAIATLRDEEAGEREDTKAPFAVTDKKPAAKPSETKPVDPLAAARPATYTVQDGDTLYKIANRFYGRTGAWRSIRDANKAIISTDGRVRAGMVITLPK